LGQPFVIEAQPGAAGQIGTERVARSPADGYTLLSANDGIITMLPNLQKHVPFDPVRDFSPIVQIIGIPIVLIAHPSVQAKTAQELVQLAKARPGKLDIRPAGPERSATGYGAFHEPDRLPTSCTFHTKALLKPRWTSSPARSPCDGRRAHRSLAHQAGRLRALGIASDKRLPLLADTPTLAEQGIPLKFATWGGLFAPAGTPVEIIRRLNRETLIRSILRRPGKNGRVRLRDLRQFAGAVFGCRQGRPREGGEPDQAGRNRTSITGCSSGQIAKAFE